ncbi:hypothetical protein C3L33_15209, partial [Rhododendron williamsianum]
MIARRWYDDSLTVALMAVLFDDCSGDLFAMTVQFDDCSDDSYIKAATKAGQIEEVEHITRESNSYDPEKTKNFLMKAKLRDPRPLINVCDRFGFVPELAHYLYSNNMLSYIEGYVEKVNPRNALLVVRQLLDDGCPEDFIKGLILSVRSLLIIEPLVEELEK